MEKYEESNAKDQIFEEEVSEGENEDEFGIFEAESEGEEEKDEFLELKGMEGTGKERAGPKVSKRQEKRERIQEARRGGTRRGRGRGVLYN